MAGILDLVGNTPMVKLNKVIVNNKVDIYAKLEGNNPGGSVKDRAAYGMIKGAKDRGELGNNIKLIEATIGKGNRFAQLKPSPRHSFQLISVYYLLFYCCNCFHDNYLKQN